MTQEQVERTLAEVAEAIGPLDVCGDFCRAELIVPPDTQRYLCEIIEHHSGPHEYDPAQPKRSARAKRLASLHTTIDRATNITIGSRDLP